MTSNRGGRLMAAMASKSTDEPQRPRRRPISDRIKARMVQKLKTRGKWVSSHCPDRTLISYMKDSRRPRRVCDECNGTGADGSRRNPEPCPVCNGKRVI